MALEHIKPKFNLKLFLITFLLIGFGHSGFADEERYRTEFFSSDSAYSLKFNMKGKWILRDSKNKTVYKIKDEWFTSKTIKISDDGKSIVVINDFANRIDIQNITAIWIFRDGKLKNKYKLNEIIRDSCNISKSVSHITWSFEDYEFDKTLAKFEITTFEMKRISFNLYDGLLLSRQIPPEFEKDVIIVYGIVSEDKNNSIINIWNNFSGSIIEGDSLRFTTNFSGLASSNFPCYIIIKDGKDITPFKYRFEILNGCE